MNQIISFLRAFFEILKRLPIFALILAIAISIRYGSTNREYLGVRLLHSILSFKHCLLSDRARPTLSADYRAFESYSGIECHLSQLFNISILHVEYRLSPEHPLLAAVDDAVAIYRALLHNNIPSSQLLFMGDSAGGDLALLTVQPLLARELPVPCGVIAISPWTDISMSSESYTRNEKNDVMLTTDRAKWAASLLLNPNQSRLRLYDPRISPLFGSFKGFAPMYVTVGTAEILEDDARGVVENARDAGVDVTFEEGLHLMHVYPLFFSYFPEARNTLDNINK